MESFLIFAKKPRRPVLIPKIGIFKSRIYVIALKIVPSPPILKKTSKELFKSLKLVNVANFFVR